MNASLKSAANAGGSRTPSANRSGRVLPLGGAFWLERGDRQPLDLARAGSFGPIFARALRAALVGSEGQRFHGDRFRRPDRERPGARSKTPRCTSICRCTGWRPTRDACCTRICPMRRRSPCSKIRAWKWRCRARSASMTISPTTPITTGWLSIAAEGERLARALGEKSVLMMGNHGVLVVGRAVPEAFERLYFLERASQAQVLALSTGRALAADPRAAWCAQRSRNSPRARGWAAAIAPICISMR